MALVRKKEFGTEKEERRKRKTKRKIWKQIKKEGIEKRGRRKE